MQDGKLFRIGDNVKLAHTFKFESFDLSTGMAKIELQIGKESGVKTHSALGAVPDQNNPTSWKLTTIEIPLAAPIFNVGHYPQESYVHPVGAGKENVDTKTGKLYEFVWKSEQESTVFCPSTGKNYKLSIDKSYLFTGKFSVIDLGRTKEVLELVCPFLNKEGVEKRLTSHRGSIYTGKNIRGKITEICKITVYRTSNEIAKYEKSILFNRFLEERIRREDARVTVGIELHNSYTEVYIPLELITHYDNILPAEQE